MQSDSASQRINAVWITVESEDPFHVCAFLAFIEEARAVQAWPDSERVRQNAYKRYEELVRQKDKKD